MNFKQLCTDVSKAADRSKARQMSELMGQEFAFKGLDSTARAFIMDNQMESEKHPDSLDWEFVECCWDQNIREFQYFALTYLTRKRNLLEKDDVKKLKKLIVEKPGWDTNNILHKLINLHTAVYPDLLPEVASWSEEEDIWLKRVTVLCQLERGPYADLDVAQTALEHSLGYANPYLEEAILESLKDLRLSHPQFVRDFVKAHEAKLNPELVRELKEDVQA